jgi:hypothetical protein
MKYTLDVEITRARGSATYVVEEEALKKFNEGEGDCIYEAFETDEFGEARVINTEGSK